MGYTTTGWLRLVVYTSAKRPGTTQIALQSRHTNWDQILFSSDQLARAFRTLISSRRRTSCQFVAEREVGGWVIGWVEGVIRARLKQERFIDSTFIHKFPHGD